MTSSDGGTTAPNPAEVVKALGLWRSDPLWGRPHRGSPRSWLVAAVVVAAVAVAVAALLVSSLLLSWVEDWRYADPFDRLSVYGSWAVLVVAGAVLLYLLAWIACPMLPPYTREGGTAFFRPGRRGLPGVAGQLTAPEARYPLAATSAVEVNTEAPIGGEPVAVMAATPSLLAVIGGAVSSGTYLTEITEREAAAVLGATAARRLGVQRPGRELAVGGHRFTVLAILEPLDPFHRDIDGSVLVGFPAAEALFDFDGRPDCLYAYKSPVSVAEGRLDRFWRGLHISVWCAVLIGVGLLGAARALNPCAPPWGRCGDPPLEFGAPSGPAGEAPADPDASPWLSVDGDGGRP